MKFRHFVTLLSLAVAFTSVLGKTVNVLFDNYSFIPKTVTVEVGDTVVWSNRGGTHTVTGNGADVFCGSDTVETTCSTTFQTPGTYPYRCIYHAAFGMTGSVVVNAPSNTAPTISITGPTNGAALPNSIPVEITVTVESSAPIERVDFFDGAILLGSDTNSPFSFNATFSPGSHVLTAKATDTTGAATTSDPVSVDVSAAIEDPIPARLAKGDITINLQLVVDGLVSPLGMATPDDGRGSVFIYDQVGLVTLLKNGVKLDSPFLDVRSRLVQLDPGYDERGLLGVATHPNFASNPLIYTYTSEPTAGAADFPISTAAGVSNNHQSVIAEWRVDSANPNRIDPNSRRELLRLDKPQFNHNGGDLRFGPDGYLYFTVGDGGAADDQGDGHSAGGNGQDLSKILGKIARIDVDTRTSSNGQYGVPTDNPLVGQSGALGEIYAFGLRNPYTMSFDKKTGELYLADVGQNDIEEIDKIINGGNFGWPVKEGTFYFDQNGSNDGFVTTTPVGTVPPNLIDPVTQFDHDEGKAIIGGYVYRGSALPVLAGTYLSGSWGEFQAPDGRLFYLSGSELKEFRIGTEDRKLGIWLKGFGEDSAGELYVCGSKNLGPSGTSGVVYKIVPQSAGATNLFTQHNLVSDIVGNADLVDTNLLNPWGIAYPPTGPFWLANNQSGVSTLYSTTGALLPLVVAVPPVSTLATLGAPSGVVFNSTTNFQNAPNTPARFIFCTTDGGIVGWNAGGSGVVKVDRSSEGASYTGLAIASTEGGARLFVADFYNRRIDVLAGDYSVTATTGQFTDPAVPNDFTPFNIQNLSGNLYIAYAKQSADGHQDVPGDGNGFISVFDIDGNLLRHLVSNGPLNSPWGFAVAPSSFGPFGGALLVGNFGDGAVNAFNLATGASLGAIHNSSGEVLKIPGLWGLTFGNGGTGGDARTLYFAAGFPNESHGLFGSIAPSAGLHFANVTRTADVLTLHWVGGVPPYELQSKATLSSPNWSTVLTTSNVTTNVPTTGAGDVYRVGDSFGF